VQYVSTFYVQVDVAGIALGFLSLLYTGRYVHIVSRLKLTKPHSGELSIVPRYSSLGISVMMRGLVVYGFITRTRGVQTPQVPGTRHRPVSVSGERWRAASGPRVFSPVCPFTIRSYFKP
jgi:hypothetical protein